MNEPNTDTYPQEAVLAMSLWQRIFALQSEGTRVEKKGRNDEHKYNYIRASDVVAVAQRLFTKWRIIPQLSYDYVHDSQPERMGITRLVATLTLINPDDSEDRIQWGTYPGAGQDGGDKGPYKAMTGAAKYAFTMACLFEPTDDPEESGKRSKPKKAQAKVQCDESIVIESQLEPGRSTGEMPKDANTFWKEMRAAGMFQVAKDKIEREHMTWQEIWKELVLPSVNGNGNGKSTSFIQIP